MRKSNTFIPQRTTSGFSGSPTLNICLKLDKSNFFTISSPAPINIRKAVGALYHTVTPYSSIILYQVSGLKRPPTITFDVPVNHGPKMPYDVPVTQPGSAVHQ